MSNRAPWLRRPTNSPSGISVGGGDTGFDITPQGHLYTVALTPKRLVAEVVLPKGAVILSTYVSPHEDAPATAGTAKIETIVGGPSGAVSGTLLAATSATAPLMTALTAAFATTDERLRFTAAGLAAGTSVRVGVQMILPRVRV